MSNFPADIELKIYVNYDAQPAEQQTWSYPGCPQSMELNGLIFVTEGDKEIKTLQELKNYALNQHTDALVEAAWDDHREDDRVPDDYA